jgi:hypothetical protein
VTPDNGTLKQAQQRLRLLKTRVDRLALSADKVQQSVTDAAVRLGRLEARLDIAEKRRK